ncbi:hypothetical protein DB31_4208 [Hyalangium minutum]|uniref:PilZ domain-containing protein n=1 Tax=Hyalangium minutum TaxID=394096 RepID=A0A085W339_9BACT|nr:hypothetical protein DB31_4208 [Hyalangium minutum]
MSQQDRRKHPRYLLHLPVKLHRGEQELNAQVINASAGGCLLQMAEALAPGEVLEASLPQLKLPRTRLIVVRCSSTPTGYMVAMYFEATLADDAAIRHLSGDQLAFDKPPVVH